MKKLLNKILILTAALLVSVSCGEDWLELELKGVQLYSPESIDTDEKAHEILMGAYDMLQVKYFSGWSSWYMIANLPSDDAVPVGGGLSDRPEYWDLHTFSYTSENPALLQFWRRNYYGVYRANNVINDVLLETDNAKRYRAEAKFLRAYFYFELARAFGNTVFYTANLSPASSDFPANTPVEVIYDQCVLDLQEAIPDLPNKSQQSSEELTKVSKGAAQALLGKVLLYQEKYSEAASALDQVINSGEYDLITEYDSLFRNSEEFGQESVFEIPYHPYLHGDVWADGRESEGHIDVQLNGPRSVVVGDINSGWGFDMIDSSLIDLWDSQGDDVRKNGTGYGPDVFKATITIGPGQTDLNDNGFPDQFENEGFTSWYQRKRVPYNGYNDPSQQADWTYGNNERVIRFSDVLLMAAEAHNQSGNDGQAQTYVNRVRARVGLGTISSTGNQLLTDIKLERRMELAMEGHRYYDLIRWGDAPNVLGAAGFVTGKNEVFPIPASEVLKSNQLQNPGY